MGRVADKACVVTGAGSGIGKATAFRLAEEGGKVVASDINFESVQKVADEILQKVVLQLRTKLMYQIICSAKI